MRVALCLLLLMPSTALVARPAGADVTLGSSAASLETGAAHISTWDADADGSADLTDFARTLESRVGPDGRSARSKLTLRSKVALEPTTGGTIELSGSYEAVIDFDDRDTGANVNAGVSAAARVEFCLSAPMDYEFQASGRVEASSDTYRVKGERDRWRYASGSVASLFFDDFGRGDPLAAGAGGTFDGRPLPAQDTGSHHGELLDGCHSLSLVVQGGLGWPTVRDAVIGTPTNPPETRGQFRVKLTLGPGDPDSNLVRWIGGGAGLFSEKSNWDPDRVPGAGDTALFDQGSATVDLATEAAPLSRGPLLPRVPVARSLDRLLVLIDPLRFTQESEVLVTAGSFDQPGLDVDGGRLELDQTVVRAVHAVVGSGSPGELEARGPAGALQTSGRFAVGRGAHGSFSLRDGGEATTAETLLGDGDEGVASASGESSSWTTGNIAVGHASAGTLAVRDGARVFSQQAVVDFNVPPGTALPVSVDVAGESPGGQPALWEVESLEVGPLGRVQIGEGGVLRSLGNVVLGNDNSERGVIVVDGGQLEVRGDLRIGDNGLGRVSVLRGQANVDGELKVGASAGVPGGGLLVLLDTDGQTRPDLVADRVAVGTDLDSFGRVVINPLTTLLTSTTAEIGGVAGSGFAELWGTWQIGSSLEVGSDAVARPDFTGMLQLFSGVAQAGTPSSAGSIAIRSGGIVVGTGTLRAASITNDGTITEMGGGITLDGSYTQGPEGQVLRSTAGAGTSPQLLLERSPAGALRSLGAPRARPSPLSSAPIVVTGDASLDGTLVLRFYGGFAPVAGQPFEPFRVEGALSGEFAEVRAEGLAPGASFDQSFQGGSLRLTSVSDAEPLPAVSLKAKPLLKEKKSKKGLKVAFQRVGDTSQPLLVQYAVGGTARNGFDYEALPGVIEIPARKKSAKLVVRPFRDGAFEEAETIELEVLPGDGYAPGLLAKATIELESEE